MVAYKDREYRFDGVFGAEVSQEEVYEDFEKECLTKMMDKDLMLFNLGDTGGGKSYTMIGTPDQPGLLPRILETLFLNPDLQLSASILEL